MIIFANASSLASFNFSQASSLRLGGFSLRLGDLRFGMEVKRFPQVFWVKKTHEVFEILGIYPK